MDVDFSQFNVGAMMAYLNHIGVTLPQPSTMFAPQATPALAHAHIPALASAPTVSAGLTTSPFVGIPPAWSMPPRTLVAPLVPSLPPSDTVPLPPTQTRTRASCLVGRRPTIMLSFCSKPKGSPGRGNSSARCGYNLRDVLGLTQPAYSWIYSAAKDHCRRYLDMRQTITPQDPKYLRHTYRKIFEEFPEFGGFSDPIWPIKDFVHLILRASNNTYKLTIKKTELAQAALEAQIAAATAAAEIAALEATALEATAEMDGIDEEFDSIVQNLSVISISHDDIPSDESTHADPFPEPAPTVTAPVTAASAPALPSTVIATPGVPQPPSFEITTSTPTSASAPPPEVVTDPVEAPAPAPRKRGRPRKNQGPFPVPPAAPPGAATRTPTPAPIAVLTPIPASVSVAATRVRPSPPPAPALTLALASTLTPTSTLTPASALALTSTSASALAPDTPRNTTTLDDGTTHVRAPAAGPISQAAPDCPPPAETTEVVPSSTQRQSNRRGPTRVTEPEREAQSKITGWDSDLSEISSSENLPIESEEEGASQPVAKPKGKGNARKKQPPKPVKEPIVNKKVLPSIPTNENKRPTRTIKPVVKYQHSLQCLVLVIDALDECEDSQGVTLLLEILASHASGLPIKIFVSSRPEPQIRQKIGDAKSKLILHELEASIVNQDIKLYLDTELRGSGIPISDLDLQTIVRHSGVLFIYAATAVRYIHAADETAYQQERIQEVLDTKTSNPDKNHDIDSLYNLIICAAFNNRSLRKSEKANLRLVLDTVVCAQEPITVEALARLLQLSGGSWVRAALKPLWSVVHIYGVDELVTILHASFPDYMLDSTRSKANRCRADIHHGQLADLCFDRIETNECQFNVCGLDSSFVLDEEVVDLRDRIKSTIPQDLWYACRYWAVHLTLGGPSVKRLHRTDGIVANQLLLWMEVLNLKKHVHIAAPMIEIAESWCKRGSAPQKTKDLVHDAWRFITMFATNDVSRSTPHIYVSMLTSWPGRFAGSNLMQRVTGLPKMEGSGMTRRQLALLGCLNASGRINSIAFSPNGMRIVSGSSDNVIQVWDSQTGKVLFDQLKGHTKAVNSVAFSPDSTRIVSGSSDNTIRMWDAQIGEPVLSPIIGHTDWVQSVTFSPDGICIVSGSDDDTVRIWDSRTGAPLLDPLKGHVRSVRSVTFSPDSIRIASGSGDRTIRVWDTRTGGMLFGPLVGHTGPIKSIAYSPNGERIVSGSDDKTTRVWDALTGQLLLDLLEGHNNSVRSVAFSPNSEYIVSGSSDNTVLVRNAHTGEVLLDPFKGHTNSVTSVTFSSSCMRIFSGSNDGTIRVWDAQTGRSLPDPLSGHTGWISSVSYSLDNMRIVSGSSDKTLQIWDAQAGEPLLAPLRGHTSSIMSAAFSPDGTRIVSGSDDWTIRVWDAKTGKAWPYLIKGHNDVVNSVAFSPDSLRIVSGSGDNTVQVWDAQSGKALLVPLEGHTGSVKSVTFSPNGMYIASGSDDSTLLLWDAQTGEPLHDPLTGHTNWVTSVAFSPDSLRIVSSSGDRTIRVWDPETGETLLGPIKGHTDWVRSVLFSPDGTRLVSGSDDKTIRVWDSQTGEPLHSPLRGHTNWVTSVAFSSNGMRIVSGSRDNTIRVWNAEMFLDSSTTSEQPHRRSWTLDERGWVRDERQRPLLWLPPDLRDRLVLPSMEFLISTEGSITLDFENAKLGESWTECYVPSPPIST